MSSSFPEKSTIKLGLPIYPQKPQPSQMSIKPFHEVLEKYAEIK